VVTLGLLRYLGVGREDSGYGTAANASRYIEAVAKLTPDHGWIIPDPICDPSRIKRNLGPFRIRGNVGPFDVTPDNIGEMINAALGNGSYDASNQDSNSRVHSWKCSNNLDSYTLHVGSEIEERILAGMLANSLNFKAAHGENVQATVAWVGPGAAEDTDTLAVLTRSNLSALQPFVYHQASGNLTVGIGDKSANIFDIELNIENNIPVDRGNFNTRYMPKNRRGSRSVTGKLSAFFDDDDEYDRFIAGEAFAMDLIFVGPVIAGGRYYTLRWYMPEVVYLRDAAHPVQPMDEPLAIDCPFQALCDDGTYTELYIQLENQLTSVSYT
jgi:hypothetical protein